MRAVNGNQRNLLLARERSRHGGLAGARRPGEQNAARRRQAHLIVNVVVHVRVLDDGIEQSFQIGEASKVGKGRSALFDKKFASRAGLDFLQAGEKVAARYVQPAQVGWRCAIRLERRGREESAQGDHAHFLAQRFEIGAHESVRMFGNLL